MALKQKVIEKVMFVGNVELLAYISVTSIFGDKNLITFNASYKKESKDGDQIKICQYSFAPNLSGDNFIAQAYEHMKTLPEFAEAEDC